MHAVAQVLIVANALRAGFPHSGSNPDVKNDPSPEIRAVYDQLRNAIKALDDAEGEAFTCLKQIELNLFRLNNAKEFQGMGIDTPVDLARKAKALLEAIEQHAPNWRKEIVNYG